MGRTLDLPSVIDFIIIFLKKMHQVPSAVAVDLATAVEERNM
jgi:hypothetical protein